MFKDDDHVRLVGLQNPYTWTIEDNQLGCEFIVLGNRRYEGIGQTYFVARVDRTQFVITGADGYQHSVDAVWVGENQLRLWTEPVPELIVEEPHKTDVAAYKDNTRFGQF